jgi:hypothetical protein
VTTPAANLHNPDNNHHEGRTSTMKPPTRRPRPAACGTICKVSTRYRRRVAEAYGRNLAAAAAADSDQQVAATVAVWEREHGLEPRDWHAIGRKERTG